MLAAGAAEIVAIADPSVETAARARRLAPGARFASGLDELLDLDLDGVVIATPGALHARQSIRALKAGVAVFCQKPLGRTAGETRAVVDAAREADRLLAVDQSYRFTEGMQKVAALARSGELGRIHAADLVFHNASGPDKAWFYDPALSGGGCVMDLGAQLVDLALWTLGFPEVRAICSSLFADGEPLEAVSGRVEDYAVANIELQTGAVVRLACSWRLQAGCDAVIAADFYGTSGGASFRNVNGSFHDFTAERFHGAGRELLAIPPDAWSGRAAADWVRRLASGAHFDPEAARLVDTARILDLIYGR
jgi:predicted dehydrogenase